MGGGTFLKIRTGAGAILALMLVLIGTFTSYFLDVTVSHRVVHYLETANLKGTPQDHSSSNYVDSSSTDVGYLRCCFRFDDASSVANMMQRFTPEYFVHQQSLSSGNDGQLWTGIEYEIWHNFSEQQILPIIRNNVGDDEPNNETTPYSYSHPATQEMVDDQHHDDDDSSKFSCELQWNLTVLNQSRPFYLQRQISALAGTSQSMFPYVADNVGNRAPRVLQLGDSISRGIWTTTQDLFSSKLKTVNLYGAPTNCLGFEQYHAFLEDWLGDCTWDLVMFNVGMHFHVTSLTYWRRDYADGLREIVSKIRNHSPSSRVVFATTTPSPLDSNDTMPDEETCPNFKLFHKAGFVASMNQVAQEVAAELNFTIHDRYAIIQPVLGMYQRPCDIHYQQSGYEYLAKNDWQVFLQLLGLASG